MQLPEMKRLVADVHRFETWSYYASLDVDRTQMFERSPAWCLDFSEVRGFVEKDPQHISSLRLFDYVFTHGDEVLYLLPGTLFELLTYLEGLLLKQYRHARRSPKTAELHAAINRAPDAHDAVKHIFEYVLSSATAELDDILDALKAVEPAAARIRLLLNSPQIRFFHIQFKTAVPTLFGFPGYFDQMYRTLNSQRNARTLNNYNDALNLTLCYSANVNKVDAGRSLFVYVTRDRACILAAERNQWEHDPIRALDSYARTPLCRDPFSAILYITDRRTNARRSDKMYLTCRDFVTKLTRTSEYRTAVAQAEAGRPPHDIEIRFDVKTNDAHRQLRDSLAAFLRRYGTLFYRVLEDTDQRRLDAFQRPVQNEYPERPITTATQSLEKLSATFGIVYKEIAEQAEGARDLVRLLEHTHKAPALALGESSDSEFGCITYVVRTTAGREAVVCTIDRFDDYYSIWWSSNVSLWAFLDIITFFWNRAADFVVSRDIAGAAARPFLDEDEKVFTTGLSMAMLGTDAGADVIADIESVDVPNLMPLTDESVNAIRQAVDDRKPFSIRINTRCGDFWFNLKTVEDLPARMGIISHWWDADVIAKIIASTNLHFVNKHHLNDLLGRVRSRVRHL